MKSLLMYSFYAGVLSAFVVCALSFKNGKRGLLSTVGAFIGGFLLEFLVLYTFLPYFAHWTSQGYFCTAGVITISSIIFTYVGNIDKDEDLTKTFSVGFVGVGVILLGAVVSMLIVPPAAFNNRVWDDIADLAKVREATVEEITKSATDDDLLKVSPASANLDAKSKMPGDLGSYTKIGTTFEQTVNGQQVYITDLHVTNWRAFRSNGKSLPGYFARPAKDTSATTNFVSGYNMGYIPEARWNKDLNRHVYLNYVINCGCIVDLLEVLEIDETGRPMYTGTVWKYSIGNRGLVATAVIVVDPETGKIDEYSLKDAPQWIDRIFSLDRMVERIEKWATYSEWDAKFFVQDTTGKMKVDSAEDVYSADGRLEYMITITSAGSDQTLKYDLRVNPRTGEVIKFSASGKTIGAVDDMIDEQTFSDSINTALGAEPIECERQLLLGEWVYYCILESRSDGGGSKGSIVGYSFLQEKHTSSPNKVIVADNFSEAWNKLRKQVSTNATDSQIQGEQSDIIEIKGIVIQVANYAIDDTILFVVKDESGKSLWFRIGFENPIISITNPGDVVTIKAYDLRVSEINDAFSINNESLPPLNQP